MIFINLLYSIIILSIQFFKSYMTVFLISSGNPYTKIIPAHTSFMTKHIATDFLLCGACGWCMECFWTGLGSIFGRRDRKLTCNTSIWMFPIYGMAAFISPISNKLKNRGTLVRGGVYTIGFFLTEFGTGELLKKFKACPWDYSKAKLNYDGIIRLDYAPVWFVVSLLYEKMLKHP